MIIQFRAVLTAAMLFMASGLGQPVGLALIAATGLTAIQMPQASAQDATSPQTQRRPSRRPTFDQFRQRVNENVVTIISGNPNGSFLFYAYDLAAAINRGDDMRILPVVGRGGAHNVRDILYLRGIDMGITQANTLTYYAKTGELGTNIRNRIVYITRLFVDEMHIIVRRDSGIDTFADLAGKRVNVSNSGSGTELTMRLVFEALDMKVDTKNMGQGDAIEQIKRGELDATICVCGSPLRSLKGITKDVGLKLIPVPYSEPLETDYIPVSLSHESYPGLIDEGETVETIGVSTVLATFNWSSGDTRYARVARFVEAFFDNFDKLKQPPRSEKWKSLNLAAQLKGWKRFKPAQDWIDKNAPKPAPVGTASANNARLPTIDERLARRQAQAAAPGDPEMQERLFREFMEWMRRRNADGAAN